jgi:hypothetical protein
MDCYNVYKKNQVDCYSVQDQVFLTLQKEWTIYIKNFDAFNVRIVHDLCLFFIGFCVYNEINTLKYLVTNQIIFCIVGLTKKLNLNIVFVQQFLHVFLTKFRKSLFVFAFQKRF